MFAQQIEVLPTTMPQGGQAVTIRPLVEDDGAALIAFGASLSQDDWLYLEDDFQNPEIIKRLVNAHAAENWRQILAVVDDTVIGYSSVRRLPGWSNHVAEIQLIVSEGWRQSGLGTAMAPVIFAAARDLGVAKVIVEVTEQQAGGRAIFERLGFRIEGILSDHVRDRHGNRHNLLILAYHIS
jgi:RimJ/RimL family protein N-acetyltransferase